MTLLYKSFKSEVACLPPSKATIGLSAGGMTGRTVKNIHPDECPRASLTLTRLIRAIIFALSWAVAVSAKEFQLVFELVQIYVFEDIVNGFRSRFRFKYLAVFHAQTVIINFRKHSVQNQRVQFALGFEH